MKLCLLESRGKDFYSTTRRESSLSKVLLNIIETEQNHGAEQQGLHQVVQNGPEIAIALPVELHVCTRILVVEWKYWLKVLVVGYRKATTFSYAMAKCATSVCTETEIKENE